MSSPSIQTPCDRAALTSTYALGALAADEAHELEAHLETCNECSDRLHTLHLIVDAFAFWPADVLSPPETLKRRLAQRIAAESGTASALPLQSQWNEPEWEQVAPGISCKLLSTDSEHDRVSMLVRLAPGVDYPPHTHAGREELHLLDGELWIDDRKLYPGDYNRAERGTGDTRVWSETGCTCVLITSTRDVIVEGQAR